MKITHLFGREDVFLIHGRRDNEHLAELHLPKSMFKATVLRPGHHNFGWGFRFGRNGDESDLGLDLYAGKVTVLWLRARAPWLKWARVEQGKPDWYQARHTTLKVHPYEGCWIEWEWDHLAHEWRSSDPWWRRWSLTKTTMLGRTSTDTKTVLWEPAVVPMPEGDYPGQLTLEWYTRRYVRWPGTLLHPTRAQSWRLEIPDGIPHWGKGENSWDCGMDGLFGTGGSTREGAIARAVESVMEMRRRHGAVDLPRPMGVMEAEQWVQREIG